MKETLIVLFLLFGLFEKNFAQKVVVDSVCYKYLSYPYFKHDNKAIADLINNAVREEMIIIMLFWNNEKDQDYKRKRIKENLLELLKRNIYEEEDTTLQKGHISYCGFEIFLNTEKVLSFKTDICLSVPHPDNCSTFYFVFDVKNGKRLLINDLITKEGFAFLKAQIKQNNKKLFENNLSEMRKEKSLSSAKNKEDYENYVDYVKTNYDACLEYTLDTILFDRFYLTSNSMVIDESCRFNYDGAAQIDISLYQYSYHWLKSKSTPYGQKLISSIEDKNHYLEGNIDGKYKITMAFQENPQKKDELTGFYYYESKGQVIELKGRKIDNQIELKEAEDTEFKGIYENGIFKGIWKNKKVTMPFEVK